MSLYDNATLIMLPGGRKVGKIYSQKPVNGSGDFAFTRNIAKYVKGKTGLLEEVAANVPAFAWVPERSRYALNIEPARTNLLLKSNDFLAASWTRPVGSIASVDDNAAISPDGTQNADRVNFVEQADKDLGLQQVVNITGGLIYVYSIYAKGEGANIGKKISIRVKNVDGANINSDLEAVLTNTWTRYSVQITFAADNTQGVVIISQAVANAAERADACLLYGIQAEQGAAFTSYINTDIDPVTRPADVATVDVLPTINKITYNIDGVDTEVSIDEILDTYTAPAGNIERVIFQSDLSVYDFTAPSDLTATVNDETGAVDLEWVINSQNCAGHKIYISSDNENFILKGTVLDQTNVYAVTELDPEVSYLYFKVVSFKGTRISQAVFIGTEVNVFPSVLTDGNTIAWYDYKKIDSILKDGSNAVSQWRDQITSGRALLQPIGSNQPTYTSDGILFDGVDNFMKTEAFDLNQPEFIYIVLKQITWTAFNALMDGYTALSGFLYQKDAQPKISARVGGVFIENSGLALDTVGIIRVLFNGGESKLQINNNAAITGSVGVGNMDGFVLGSNAAGNAQYGNILVKEIIIRTVVDSAENEALIYNYLKTKYGL